MAANQKHLESLREIRSIMEKSSRFTALSGLSGIFIGITALFGVLVIYLNNKEFFLGTSYTGNLIIDNQLVPSGEINAFLWDFITTGLLVLIVALLFGTLFTMRNARRKREKIWSPGAKLMLMNLLIPLIAGGVFCLALFYHHVIYLIAPATLIFYGLALFNASKYTVREIRVLGITEIMLGLTASFFTGYGLIIWAIGFGLLHIIYGATMYWKYERVTE